MAKFKRETDFKVEIDEIIGVLNESDTHDWCIAVARISWNENPSKLDIRNMNLTQNKFGKGVSLSDEEAERLTDLLIESDFGSVEVMQRAIRRKVSRFTVSDEMTDDDIEQGMVININLPKE